MRAVIGSTYVRFDKGGENFYDQISALHKSVRGSDPDAALYWLCRMLAGGCDPLYIARRALRMASEDIGNADPRALTMALEACAPCTNAWAARRANSPSPRPSCSWLARRRATRCIPGYNAGDGDGRQELGLARGAPAFAQRADPPDEGDRLRQGTIGMRMTSPAAMPPGERYFPDDMPERRYYVPVPRGLEIKIGEALNARARARRAAAKLISNAEAAVSNEASL